MTFRGSLRGGVICEAMMGFFDYNVESIKAASREALHLSSKRGELPKRKVGR
jgi:hypothetical protein